MDSMPKEEGCSGIELDDGDADLRQCTMAVLNSVTRQVGGDDWGGRNYLSTLDELTRAKSLCISPRAIT